MLLGDAAADEVEKRLLFDGAEDAAPMVAVPTLFRGQRCRVGPGISFAFSIRKSPQPVYFGLRENGALGDCSAATLSLRGRHKTIITDKVR